MKKKQALTIVKNNRNQIQKITENAARGRMELRKKNGSCKKKRVKPLEIFKKFQK